MSKPQPYGSGTLLAVSRIFRNCKYGYVKFGACPCNRLFLPVCHSKYNICPFYRSNVICVGLCFFKSSPSSAAAKTAFSDAPCSPPVFMPADLISIPSFGKMLLATASAIGLRHVLPVHTKSIFIKSHLYIVISGRFFQPVHYCKPFTLFGKNFRKHNIGVQDNQTFLKF